MIVYLDTSTLLKLLIDEPGSDEVALLWRGADVVASTVLVAVEARSALAAARRSGRLSTSQHRAAIRELATYLDGVLVVEATGSLIAEAAELAEAEALRGYDAVHLASALSVTADVMSSADSDLCTAAAHRGLYVANPLEGSG